MADENLWVEFFSQPVELKAQAEKLGHPVFEDRDFIRIVIPGDNTTIVERPVKSEDKIRFAPQWQRYQAGQTEALIGWRIEEWPALTRAQAAQLKACGCHTVEQLASSSDSQLQRMGMGMLTMREKAMAALKAAQDSSAAEAYAVENQRLKIEIEEMKRQMKELANRMEEDAPRRGRPPKEAA